MSHNIRSKRCLSQMQILQTSTYGLLNRAVFLCIEFLGITAIEEGKE